MNEPNNATALIESLPLDEPRESARGAAEAAAADLPALDSELSDLFPGRTAAARLQGNWKARLLQQFEQVNKELWLILSMFLIVGVMNYLVTAQRMMLGLYTLPTLLSAYFYGRRHATLTAVASIILVGIVVYYNPALLQSDLELNVFGGRWFDIFAWGAILMVTAYAMGTLYERNQQRLSELRKAYRGLIIILRQFISKDKYTENHCYRVSVYAAKIAAYLGLRDSQIDDIRAAALLHDLGKLDISREILYKAAKLSQEEVTNMRKHVDKGVEMLEFADTPLNRIIPIILTHHERFDGSGYYGSQGADIPLEARIITVADVYDALASDRPYRKALTPFEARDQIAKGSGTEFDPRVVEAFLKAFRRGDMEVPEVVV
jgi:putative nucleotidyltransferase with HDIG domain